MPNNKLEMMNDHIAIGNLQEAVGFVRGIARPIVLIVEEGDGDICGPVIDKTFGYRFGIRKPNIARVIRDFRNYESKRGRTPLVFVVGGVVLPPTISDDSEYGWVVHATDAEAGASIVEMRRLCSRQYLCSRGITFRQFGRQELGEPADYADLVNFGPIREPWAEVVVASKQHGRFCSESTRYDPGMRFYFSIQSLVAQPNYEAFLGGHAVSGFIDLDKVVHRIVTIAELGEDRAWTPRTFTEAADRLFQERISNQAVEHYGA